MKAYCESCGSLRNIDYPRSTLEDGAFVISGTCEVCGTPVEQKRRVILA